MREMVRLIAATMLLAAAAPLSGCKDKAKTEATPNPRPVTVLELRESDPIEALQLTGSVKAWKDQDVAFEVDGRVEWIVEMGTQLEGRWETNSNGVVTVVVEGDVLARIDSALHVAALDAAAAERDFEKVNLERVLPAEVERSKANLYRQKTELERIMGIDVSARQPIEEFRAKANFDMAAAQVARAEANKVAGQASLAKAEAALRQAELDLEHSVLHAPFQGEVSEVYVEAGGYVHAGDNVAHLIMMDPIKIDVAVSATTAKRLRTGDPVRVFLPPPAESAIGSIYEKATAADPETRTFRISAMVRNRRYAGSLLPDDPLLDLPRITRFIYLQHITAGDDSSFYFVEENRALRKDKDGYFVWADPGKRHGDRIDPERPVATLRKFRVTPGDRRRSLQGLYLIREIVDIGDLPPGSLIALDVPPDLDDGGEVVIAVNRWLLQPGQLIPVVFGESVPVPGYYVPMNAIKPHTDNAGDIFLAVDGVVRKIGVNILGNVGEQVRVEGVDPDASALIAAGTQLIVEHIHFLQDGEPVRVIRRTEVGP